MARETLMTQALPVASSAKWRQIALLGVLGGLARLIIMVRYPPFAKEPGLGGFAQAHE